MSISKKLFLDNDKKDIASKSYNIFYYFASFAFDFLELFNYKPDWKRTNTFIECSDEMSMQLDITYILRRLIFLEAAVSKTMETH